MSFFCFIFLLPAGIPLLVDHAELELTVVYNACLCSVAHSQFSDAELVLKQAAERGTPLWHDITIHS